MLVLTLFHLRHTMVGMSEDNLQSHFFPSTLWAQRIELGSSGLAASDFLNRAICGPGPIKNCHSAHLLQSSFPSSACRPRQKLQAGLGGDCFSIVSHYCSFFKPFQPFLPPVVSVPTLLPSTGHLALSRPFELASGCQSGLWLAGGKTKELRISRGGTDNY